MNQGLFMHFIGFSELQSLFTLMLGLIHQCSHQSLVSDTGCSGLILCIILSMTQTGHFSLKRGSFLTFLDEKYYLQTVIRFVEFVIVLSIFSRWSQEILVFLEREKQIMSSYPYFQLNVRVFSLATLVCTYMSLLKKTIVTKITKVFICFLMIHIT